MYKIIYFLVGILCVSLFPNQTSAMSNCTFNANDINFGAINPLSTTDVTANTTFNISCTGVNSTVAFYTLSSLQGFSSSFNPRQMPVSGVGPETINYNIYTDNTYTTVWGNGGGGSSAITRANFFPPFIDCPPSNPCQETVYGRISLPQPTVITGSYIDQVTVNLDWFF